MKKSMIATAVMMAISGTAFAAAPQWEEPTAGLTEHQVTGSASVTKIEADAYATAATSDTTNVYANIDTDNTIITNNLWGKVTTNEGRLAIVNIGSKTNTDISVTNQGNLYIQGEANGKWWGTAAVKTYGTFENKGLIYAKDAIGVMANTESNATIINNGTIVAEGTGVEGGNTASAMEASAGGATTELVNNGTIYALGDANGVRLGDKTTGSSFTNSGNIYADEDAYAIYANNSGSNDPSANPITVYLNKGSHIEGLVGMDENSVLSIKEVSGETIALETIRGKAGGDGMTVSLASSDVTIEQGTDAGLKINKLTVDKSSSANFLLNALGTSEDKVLTINTVSDGEQGSEADINVTYSGAVSDELAKDPSQKSNLFDGLSLGESGSNNPSEVAVLEGKYGDSATYVLDGNGQVVATNVRVNSLLASTQDVAINSALMWRTQLSSYTDRMSALRTNPQSAGIWARYINGRLDGEGITHDYNTVEIGYDHKVSDLITLGASVSYTIGDADLRAGQADNDTYTAGLYATLNQNNFFVDAMVKVGYIDSDYDISNQSWSEHGDYDMFGAIFGLETGYRFNVNSFFFEPLARLTFSKLSPESYNTNLRSVNFDDIESFVGSLGFISGFNFNEKGSVYAGASYNYDFMGSVNSEITTDNAVRYFKSELDDSWGEAKIGASYMFMDNLNAFMDVSRDIGADIEQQWRVNLGARYMF